MYIGHSPLHALVWLCSVILIYVLILPYSSRTLIGKIWTKVDAKEKLLVLHVNFKLNNFNYHNKQYISVNMV